MPINEENLGTRPLGNLTDLYSVAEKGSDNEYCY